LVLRSAECRSCPAPRSWTCLARSRAYCTARLEMRIGPSRNRSSDETGLDIAAADPANTGRQRDLSFVRQRIADLEASASETWRWDSRARCHHRRIMSPVRT
jgi:hypothetical protein